MKENFEKYLTTNQFAKMYNINKKTLIYYDEINLFKPHFVKENGYRYYSIHQGSLFEVILILKQLGMPLKAIKEYLKNRNVEELNNILLEQKENIEKQVEELNRINNIIKNRLNILDSYKDIKIGNMQIEDLEEEYLVLSSNMESLDEINIGKSLCEYVSKMYNNKIYNGFCLGAMIKDKNIIEGNYLNYSYFYTKLEKKPKNIEYFTKPKGKYLVFYYKGHWAKFYEIYSIAKDYLAKNNLKISGYSYEEYIKDDATAKTEEDYITKFMIQIS